MSSLNKATLIGNIGQNPEIRTMQNGKELATLSLATSTKWKDKQTGEQKESTEWHRVVVYSEGLVNLVKNYVKKGSRLYVEGQLQTRKWQGKDGKDNYTTEVVLQGYNATIVLLDSKPVSDNTHSDDIDSDPEIPF